MSKKDEEPTLDPRSVDLEFADGTVVEGFDFLAAAEEQYLAVEETFDAMRAMGFPEELVAGVKDINDEKLADIRKMRAELEEKDTK